MRLFVGVTDRGWYQHLRALRPDDLNYWRPSGSGFRALAPGDPFLFKLHAPWNAVVGGGFFVTAVRVPVSGAWMAFGPANGVADVGQFVAMMRRYRGADDGCGAADPVVGAILLTQPYFFDEGEWLPAPSDWHPSTVLGRVYDVGSGIGRELWLGVRERLAAAGVDAPDPSATPDARHDWVCERLGPGSFRVLVTEAYGRRCAVTGERLLATLEATHIRPLHRDGPNRVDNGLLLRADIRRLFDQGLATVEPDLRFRVSERVRGGHTGGGYDALDGRELVALPDRYDQRPARAFLEYHRSAVFRG
jgi:putative restriction endonuclease